MNKIGIGIIGGGLMGREVSGRASPGLSAWQSESPG
jgi:hypothetical protein